MKKANKQRRTQKNIDDKGDNTQWKQIIQRNENTLNTTRNDNKHWKTYNGKTWTIDQQH